jgi:membrane protein DedA with SNARE-associated domain
MQQIVERMDDIGYFLLFFYSLGGGFVGLATAAVLASLGKISLVYSIIIAATANFAGSTALFYFARKNKTDASEFLRKHRRKLAYIHIMMKKKGSSVIFIQKFIYGIKTLVPLAAGITKFDSSRFTVLNLVASIIWAISIGVGGYFAGALILKVVHHIENYPFIAPLALIIIGGSIYLYITKITKRN